jgi:hypothetical protein
VARGGATSLHLQQLSCPSSPRSRNRRTRAMLLNTALTSPVSSQIISSVIPGAGIVRTMEWTLLLSVLSLPGVFLGAAIVKYTGRRNLLMMGFSGYIVFGLIVGIAYDKITLVVPAFIVMYAMMQSSGNFVS